MAQVEGSGIPTDIEVTLKVLLGQRLPRSRKSHRQ